MKHILSLVSPILLTFLSALSLSAQIDVDKPINMSGDLDAERAITNLALPVNDTDAVNKEYVDSAVSAGGGGSCGPCYTNYVGQLYQGGVVAVVYKDANEDDHGLIVSLTDVGAARSWSGTISTAVGTTLWDGLTDSNAIMAQNSNSAAADCRNYGGGGYSDWFLPSIEDYRLIFGNMLTVTTVLRFTSGATPISREYYWASSEASATTAWRLNFDTGATQGGAGKGGSFRVRCARVF